MNVVHFLVRLLAWTRKRGYFAITIDILQEYDVLRHTHHILISRGFRLSLWSISDIIPICIAKSFLFSDWFYPSVTFKHILKISRVIPNAVRMTSISNLGRACTTNSIGRVLCFLFNRNVPIRDTALCLVSPSDTCSRYEKSSNKR